MTIKDVAEFLKKNDSYLILQHRRPDGDALGSSAGLCHGLRKLGKTAYLLPNGETTDKYRGYVQNLYAPENFMPHTIITVDTAAEDMLQYEAERYAGDIDLAIDHHPSNTEYAALGYIRPEKAACGEIIFEILKELPVEVSTDIATVLYFAISTDTGCFCYANTTADTLDAAAQLVRLGAPNAYLNKIMHRTKSRKRLELEGMIISGMDFYRDGKVAFCTVTRDMLDKTGICENDLEDVAGIPGQVEGVIVGVTIKEQVSGQCKISVRTTDVADANDICAPFGGGGHKMAAGCSIDESPERAKELILKSVDRVFRK